ncbi:hypothetical protein Tco_1474463 [Tanacetum coccineum]
MKVFNLILSKKVKECKDFKYHFWCKDVSLTHMCFVDDLLVICHGDVKSVKVIKKVITEFSNYSGLLPNLNKRTVYFGNVKIHDRQDILIDFPFKVGQLPVRLQLIAAVLSLMHIFWASVFMIPKTMIKDNDKVLKGFLWSQGDLKKGSAKISWKEVCKPKSHGGLGIKLLGPWNETLLVKHIWNIANMKETSWVKWVHVVKLKGRSF